MMKKRVLNKYVYAIFFIVILSLIIECFVFNYRYWESRNFSSSQKYTIHYGKGIKKVGNATYKILNNKKAYIELRHINQTVNNLYLDFMDINNPNSVIPVQIAITDSGNAVLTALPKTEIVHNIVESQYVRLHLTGKSSKIRIVLADENNGTVINCKTIKINQTRPFKFRLKRFVLIFLLGLLIYLFNPKSKIYQVDLNWKEKKQKGFIILLVFGLIFAFYKISAIFAFPDQNNSITLCQYDYLAQAFMKGHVYLDFKVPSVLMKMKNPYDVQLRNTLLKRAGQSSILDVAYYNGKYYSYFGILPVLLFYLPYRLLTGHMLYTGTVTLICSILFIIVCFWFMYTFCKRYFSISMGVYLLLCIALVFGSEILYCIQMPTLYSVPIELAILLILTGLTCWIKSKEPGYTINKKWLILGSISEALVLGCRPQLMLTTILVFPIFWDEIKARQFFSKKGLINTLCVVLPYFIFGIAIMYYNYIRFDSPFNFGATYNLTGFDMTHRGIIPQRFILGFFEYFFQPLNIKPKFPYIYAVASHMGLGVETDYQGIVINEPLLGGFFSINLIGLSIFMLYHYRNVMKQKRVLGIMLGFLAVAVVIVALDIQIVGMTLRYLTDFSMLFLLSCFCIILSAQSSYQEINAISKSRALINVLFWLVVFCVVTNLLLLIADGRYNQLLAINPPVYYKLKYLVFSVLSIR